MFGLQSLLIVAWGLRGVKKTGARLRTPVRVRILPLSRRLDGLTETATLKWTVFSTSSWKDLHELQLLHDFCPFGSQSDGDFRQNRTLRHATLISLWCHWAPTAWISPTLRLVSTTTLLCFHWTLKFYCSQPCWRHNVLRLYAESIFGRFFNLYFKIPASLDCYWIHFQRAFYMSLKCCTHLYDSFRNHCERDSMALYPSSAAHLPSPEACGTAAHAVLDRNISFWLLSICKQPTSIATHICSLSRHKWRVIQVARFRCHGANPVNFCNYFTVIFSSKHPQFWANLLKNVVAFASGKDDEADM